MSQKKRVVYENNLFTLLKIRISIILIAFNEIQEREELSSRSGKKNYVFCLQSRLSFIQFLISILIAVKEKCGEVTSKTFSFAIYVSKFELRF